VFNSVAYVESYGGKYLPNPQLPHLLPKRTSAPFRLLPDYTVAGLILQRALRNFREWLEILL